MDKTIPATLAEQPQLKTPRPCEPAGSENPPLPGGKPGNASKKILKTLDGENLWTGEAEVCLFFHA